MAIKTNCGCDKTWDLHTSFTCVNAVFFADIYFSKCSLSTHHPFRVFIAWIVILILNRGSSSFFSCSLLDLENEARSRLLCCCWSWLSLYCVQGNDLNLHSKLFKNGVQNKCSMYMRVHIKKTRVFTTAAPFSKRRNFCAPFTDQFYCYRRNCSHRRLIQRSEDIKKN